MRGIVFLLCLYCVQASGSDWLNRTIRVDFVVDSRAFHIENDFPRPSPINDRRGIDATNGQFPWTILTVSRSPTGQGFICSGTIISDSYFLSDLRCLGQREINPPANAMGIHIGSSIIEWPYPPATNFVRHFWYIAPSPQNSPNIALCRIHEPLTFNPNVQPIRLPYAANANFSYEAWSSLLLGYRLSANVAGQDQLQSVPNNILQNSQCNFLGRLDDHEMCGLTDVLAYNSTSPIRFSGFSGGAWMVYEYAPDLDFHPVLIGIHHYQFFNGTGDTFGRATRVSHFLEWISALTDVDNN